MPVAVITVSVRGWGENPGAAMAQAKDRLNDFNDNMQGGTITNDPGTDYRILDPGNGGPCAPERVNFEFLIAGQDLPEFRSHDDD